MCSSLVLAALVAATPPLGQPADTSSVVLHAPRATLVVAVAANEAARERGLMNRRTLPIHGGMLFVFDRDEPVEFWMKDTLIPLDMVFIGGDGIVRSVAARVAAVRPDTPDSRIPRRSGNARFVIELGAGEAARDGLAPGVRIPELGAFARPRPTSDARAA